MAQTNQPETDPGELLDQAIRDYVASREPTDRFLTGYALIATHETMQSDDEVIYSLASLTGQSHVTTLGLIHAGLLFHQDRLLGDDE